MVIGKSKLLRLAQKRQRHSMSIERGQFLIQIDYVLQFVQKPLVDLGQLPNLIHGVLFIVHGICNCKQALIRRVFQFLFQITIEYDVVLTKPSICEVYRANSLLHSFLKIATDSHDLSNRFHRRSNFSRDSVKLFQIPSRNFDHAVVQTRLKARAGYFGHAVFQLIKRNIETELSSNKGQRISSCLTSQRRTSRKTSIDFDDAIFFRVRIQSVLDIAFAYDTQVPDHVDGGGSQHIVILIRQRLRRGNNYGITSMNAEWIKILHVTNGDTVVIDITDNLVLNFLPSLHTTLNQHLRTDGKRLLTQYRQLLGVVCKSTT
eukprot:Partr_v1_DN28995_c0_g1_i1_m25773